VASYKAGFNPWNDEHPANDFPHHSLRKAFEADQWPWVREQVDDITRGIIAADDPSVTPDILMSWPRYIRAGYLAKTGREMPGTGHDELLHTLREKIIHILAKWDEMEGDNPPLARHMAGPRRDFDINIDGFAHIGLLPDFLQDMRNVGLTPDDFAPLFRSAYDYVQMWQTCVQKANANAPVKP
jgi:hypothetical protein